jgi:hypothetical protein
MNGVSAVADKPGDILSQPNRLKQAKILGGNIIKYISTGYCAETIAD